MDNTSQMWWQINDGCVRKVGRVLHTHGQTHTHTHTQAPRAKWVNAMYEWACFIIAGRYDANPEWYMCTLQFGFALPNGFANPGSDNQLKLRTMGSDPSTQGYTSCVMISHWSKVFNLTTKDGASWGWSFSECLKWSCGEISSKWMFVIWASECDKDLRLQSSRSFSDLRFRHASIAQ